MVFLVGISLYITYAKESGNAAKYQRAMKDARDYFRAAYPSIDASITIDKYRKKRAFFSISGSIKFWRGSVIAIMNSAIGSSSLKVLFDSVDALGLFVLFVGFVVFHTVIYKIMFEAYESDTP